MEPLVRPVISVKYEIARQMVMELLQNGLISKVEFDVIDAENRKSFLDEK